MSWLAYDIEVGLPDSWQQNALLCGLIEAIHSKEHKFKPENWLPGNSSKKGVYNSDELDDESRAGMALQMGAVIAQPNTK